MMDLPSNWCVATVAEIAEPLRYGYTASANPEADGPRMLRITDIQNGQVQWSCVPRCEIAPQRRDQYLLSPGDIVFARTGGTVGKSFLIREVPEPAVFASYLIKVASATGVEARYLYWFFQSLNYWGQIALRKGGLQGNVNAKTLGAIELPFAPTNEQRRIAMRIEALFDEIDRGVESLRDTKRVIGLYRQSLLKSAFEGRLTAQWREENPEKLENPKSLLARIRDEREKHYAATLEDWERSVAEWREGGEKSKRPAKPKQPVRPEEREPESLRELPEGWFYISFDAIASSIRNGISVKPDGIGPLKIFRISAVRPMAFDLNDFRRITDWDGSMEDYRLKHGDLVFTRYSGSREYVGVSAMYRGDGTHVYPDKLIRCQVESDLIDVAYLEAATNCGESRSHIEGRIRTTAGQSGVSGTDIKSCPVPICPPAEQAQVVRILNERLHTVDTLQVEIDINLTRAEALRQSILKQAFSGKLVPQDPDDEPAGVLLQRIRAKNASQEQKRRRPGAGRR